MKKGETMTTQERVDHALELKHGNCNCAQAALLAFSDRIDMDEKKLYQLAAGFGGGMGCMEGNCGALVGAVMACGMIKEGKGCARYSRGIYQEFVSKCGSSVCKELKGVETGKMLCSCDDCVRHAVCAADSIL